MLKNKFQKFIILGVMIIVIIIVSFLIILDKNKLNKNHKENQIKNINLEIHPIDTNSENVIENWHKERSYGAIIYK